MKRKSDQPQTTTFKNRIMGLDERRRHDDERAADALVHDEGVQQ